MTILGEGRFSGMPNGFRNWVKAQGADNGEGMLLRITVVPCALDTDEPKPFPGS